MPRPRKDDTRNHQLNIRFTPREFARIHHHAGLTGKTPTEFGRTVMLRRPRSRKRDAPALITLSQRQLLRWHMLGLTLNDLAHRFNATGELPACDLSGVIRALRALLRRSFPEHFRSDAVITHCAIAPAPRHHLRKTCTNLVQVADRYRALSLQPPLPLSHLIARFRGILNADRSMHGP